MSNVTGEQVMRALVKEPFLFHSVMGELDMVLRMWAFHEDKDSQGLWRRFYKPDADGEHVGKIRVYRLLERWRWEHIRRDGGLPPDEWGEADSEEEVCRLADEWARSRGYYLLEG
jgi:hypothetical protein